MSSFLDFTANRVTTADPASLLASLRVLDATAGVFQLSATTYRLKKATAWTAPQIAAAQNVLDTAPATSPQLTAQAEIDRLGILEKAILLALIDQLNLIRSKLVPPLGAITPAAAIQAARDKAGTL
jgi:hypothetical protein